MFDSDSIMRCSTKIPSVENTLKKSYLGRTLLDEFEYTYYDYNNDTFGMFFQQYESSDVENIYHPYYFF